MAKKKIQSAKTRLQWEHILRLHLLPAFGEFYIDAIGTEDIEAWLTKVGERVKAGEYSPHTVNSWMAMLRVIMNSAVKEYHLERNPIMAVEGIDTSTHFTYTDEEPNSLLVDEVPAFPKAMKRLYPQYFGMVALGFATGLRPSSLRPLRRLGDVTDVKWDANAILIRRSQTRPGEVMEATKQKTRYRLTLPQDLMDILRWHTDRLREGAMMESTLLFPSEEGGFRSPSCLDKPFRAVATAIGLKKHITPKGMRRTFQDLARKADIEAMVRQKICGHATDEMSELYSTIPQMEIQAAVAAVISVAKYKEIMGDSAPWWESGVKDAVGGLRNEKSQLEIAL